MEQEGSWQSDFRSIEEKLHHEIRVLSTAMSKIELHGGDQHEQRVYAIYERILTRRKQMLSRFCA
jgi:uncharacterized protein YqeY